MTTDNVAQWFRELRPEDPCGNYIDPEATFSGLAAEGLEPGSVELSDRIGPLRSDALVKIHREYKRRIETGELHRSAIKKIKTIMRNGNSLTITITAEAAELGIGRGDLVELTIKKI